MNSVGVGGYVLQAQASDRRIWVGAALYLGVLERGRFYRINRRGKLQSFDTQRRAATLATASSGLLWATTDTEPGRLLPITLPHG